MRKIIILILLCIYFVGCSSSRTSLNDINYDKRKILFIVDRSSVTSSYEGNEKRALINEFIDEFKNNLIGSLIEPVGFQYLEAGGIPKYDYDSELFKKGYLNFYNNVYSEDNLRSYKPDDIIFLTFDFEYSVEWHVPKKITSVNLHVFNSTTRSLKELSIEKSLFSNLSKKVINNLSELTILTNPKYDNDLIVKNGLIDISKKIDEIKTINEYGSQRGFEYSINEISIIKNRLEGIENLTHSSDLLIELQSLKTKLNQKIYEVYCNYSANQIDKKEATIKYEELLKIYERYLSDEQKQSVKAKLQNLTETKPSVSVRIKGLAKLDNSNLQQFSKFLEERVQNIWHTKDTITFTFQYKNNSPVTLIVEYHSKEFPFSYINIDNYNYSILDAIGIKLLLNLLDSFLLYRNNLPELTYDLDEFFASLIFYYNDSKGSSVGLFCFAYGNMNDGLNIKVSEVGYKYKSWPTYKSIKSNSNFSSAISFTTFDKEFLQFLSIL